MPKQTVTATKARSSKAKPRPVAITTLVDPELKKRWEAVAKRITSATHEEAQDFDHKWEAVSDAVFADPPLYLAGGYATEKDFFLKFVKVDRFTGIRKARVARYASPAEIETWGDTKIDAALDFLEAKTGGPLGSHLPLALDKVRVPVKGQGAALSLAQASREQLRAATRDLRASTAGHVKASPRGALLQKALAAAGLKKVSVTVHRDGFDLRGLTWDDAGQLARVKWPKTPPAQK